MDILDLAKEIKFNSKAEAQAILDYTNLLKSIGELDIEEADKEVLTGKIAEIIADEMNHEKELEAIYTGLTGIEAKKE